MKTVESNIIKINYKTKYTIDPINKNDIAIKVHHHLTSIRYNKESQINRSSLLSIVGKAGLNEPIVGGE